MQERVIKKVNTLQRELQEAIVLTMLKYVAPFKQYVTAEEDYYVSKHLTIEGREGKINYGCAKDKYYYCFLPNTVQFIYEGSLWHSNLIIFNDKIKCWFAYDIEKKEKVAIQALDTDSQIAFLRKLHMVLDKILEIFNL